MNLIEYKPVKKGNKDLVKPPAVNFTSYVSHSTHNFRIKISQNLETTDYIKKQDFELFSVNDNLVV